MTRAGHRHPCVAAGGRWRRAFTLIEMVVSLAIVAILCLACASLMTLAARAMSGQRADDASVQAASARAAADQIAADLKMAASFAERTAQAITFTVPDRDGDGSPETLRYAWAGAGSPVTRQRNGLPVPAAPIAENVQVFDLQYLVRTVGPSPSVEGAEQVLVCHDDAPGGTFRDFQLDNDTWCGTYLRPALPSNAVSWKITRVKIMAKQLVNPTDSLAVEIRSAGSTFRPTTTVLQSTAVPESSLPTSYFWTDVPFGASPALGPSVGAWLVIRQTTSIASAGRVHWEDAVTETNNLWTTTSDGGSGWTAPSDAQHMRFYVYGIVTTRNP